VAQGFREPTDAQLDGDPSGNRTLTVDDAILLLNSISTR
jgi:hypothetical protein